MNACREQPKKLSKQDSTFSNRAGFEHPWQNPHKLCRPHLSEDFGEASDTHRGFGLDLRFLRTCRQIYDEAKNVCYKTNIISFDNYDCLVFCVEILSWVSYIRSIRIHIRYWDHRAERSMYYISSKADRLTADLYRFGRAPMLLVYASMTEELRGLVI